MNQNYQFPKYFIKGYDKCLVGISNQMLKIFDVIDNLSEKQTTVLIKGETGTGKELVARALHYNSSTKRKGNYVPIDCCAFNIDIVDSQL